MGFSDAGVMALVFAEAALPCLLGAALGMTLAKILAVLMPGLLPPNVNLPEPYIAPSLFAAGLCLCAAGGGIQLGSPSRAPCAAGCRHRLVGTLIMLKQIIAVTAMNFKSLKNRIAPSLVIVVGMACVVGVLLSMLSLTEGLLSAIRRTERSAPCHGDVASVPQHVRQHHCRAMRWPSFRMRPASPKMQTASLLSMHSQS